ncbi:hypothetical protein [Burkholderia sp. MSMB617WGS]|nr:hypothetical protein [Burkholderia sp. MSMB617WGS]
MAARISRVARIVEAPSIGALDRLAGKPSRQLVQALRDAIRRGGMKPGDA